MEIDEFRNYCLSKPQTTEEFPFDEDVLVFEKKTYPNVFNFV